MPKGCSKCSVGSINISQGWVREKKEVKGNIKGKESTNKIKTSLESFMFNLF